MKTKVIIQKILSKKQVLVKKKTIK